MHIPTENLTLIIHFALQDAEGSTGRQSRGHAGGMSLVAGFSRASQQFRQIVLREVFRTYHVTAASDLLRLDDFPEVYKWVRVMHCPVNVALLASREQYARFANLRVVHLLESEPSFGLTSVLEQLPTSIQELTTPFDHNNDHQKVLTTLTRFVNLVRLRVTRSRFDFPPAPEVPSGDVPPHHYSYSHAAAEMLKPLPHLRILQIDHYLTDTECFEFHNTQCPWSCASSAFCPTCWNKFGEQTINAEITCTRIMAESMQSLEVIIWKSWFTADAEGHSRVFIDREIGSEGRREVRIRREREAIESSWQKLATGLSQKCRVNHRYN